jgi:nicotinamidase-related amidase
MLPHRLPLPPHYDPQAVGKLWKVPYEERAQDARRWAAEHGLRPAALDEFRLCLMLVDVQNTFCLPGFELFVGGRSGTGAVDDCRRLSQFIYRNLGRITQIAATLDTHQAAQIFHGVFLVDEHGRHPDPYTLVSVDDLEGGRWRFNRDLAPSLGVDPEYGQGHLLHYARRLKETGKYELTIWPYHAMLGGVGHALVPAVEEAVFFHSLARSTRPDFQQKGAHPFTEHYSVLGPEVAEDHQGQVIGQRNQAFLEKLLSFDAVAIAGQAKSHCVAWTIDDLLRGIRQEDEALARKVYLLEDCSSPVVVPGVVDYSEAAEQAFLRFAEAGMHVVQSSQPVEAWPGVLAGARG